MVHTCLEVTGVHGRATFVYHQVTRLRVCLLIYLKNCVSVWFQSQQIWSPWRTWQKSVSRFSRYAVLNETIRRALVSTDIQSVFKSSTTRLMDYNDGSIMIEREWPIMSLISWVFQPITVPYQREISGCEQVWLKSNFRA